MGSPVRGSRRLLAEGVADAVLVLVAAPAELDRVVDEEERPLAAVGRVARRALEAAVGQVSPLLARLRPARGRGTSCRGPAAACGAARGRRRCGGCGTRTQPPAGDVGEGRLARRLHRVPWQSAHSAFTGFRVANGSAAPGPRWQVLQSPLSKGACRDSRKRACGRRRAGRGTAGRSPSRPGSPGAAARSDASIWWQEAHRAAPPFVSSPGLSLACGSWHVGAAPLGEGGVLDLALASSASTSVVAAWRRGPGSAATSRPSFGLPCGRWQAAHLPSATGRCTALRPSSGLHRPRGSARRAARGGRAAAS